MLWRIFASFALPLIMSALLFAQEGQQESEKRTDQAPDKEQTAQTEKEQNDDKEFELPEGLQKVKEITGEGEKELGERPCVICGKMVNLQDEKNVCRFFNKGVEYLFCSEEHRTEFIKLLIKHDGKTDFLQEPKQGGKPEKEEKAQESEQVATIESIEGDCEVRESEKAEWVAATVKAVLPKGSSISTGAGSGAVLIFPGKTTVEVGSFTEIKIDEFFQSRERLETKLKLKVGRLTVTVEKGAIKSDFEVSTPHTTTAVKGTRFTIESSYYGDVIEVENESVRVTNSAGTSVTVREGEKTDSDLNTDYECRKIASAGNPLPHGATDEEQKFARDNLSFDGTTPGMLSSSPNPDVERQQREADSTPSEVSASSR
jgi:YHS domain-containing protein